MEKAYLCVLPVSNEQVLARRHPARQLRSMFRNKDFQDWLDMCEREGENGETYHHEGGEYVVVLVGTW